MVQNNDAAPDIEQLDRDEFVVNTEARETQLARNKKAVRCAFDGFKFSLNNVAL